MARIRSIFMAIALAALAWPAAAEPSSRPIAVVELFTSQGCNSCPPADVLLSRLAERGDVIALAYHVDYWDYLGWQDTLATAENTERQNAYNKAFGNRSVYTPQFIVNGRKHLSGAKTAMVEKALTSLDRKGIGMTVDLSAQTGGDSIVISVGPAAEAASKAHVTLAFFEPSKRVQVKGGRNVGRTFVYRNSVMATQSVGMWHGQQARFELPIDVLQSRKAGGAAVLLQQVDANGLPGAIIGAALIEMPAS